jgi:NhaA family Na+:H+ antiporter
MAQESAAGQNRIRLLRPVEKGRDHIRGGGAAQGVVTVVVYGDYLCPYCRRLRLVLQRLQKTFGERLAYVFRHYPNETVHPGATFLARAAEAAGRQDRFWELHDWIYAAEPPLSEEQVFDAVRDMGLDVERFAVDTAGDEGLERVSGTPTIFVKGERYDGAWDFHSMLEALELPVASRVQRSARAFASLPASGGLVLVLAALVALVCANTGLEPLYRVLTGSDFAVGPPGHEITLTVAEWFSEGLLAIFFLLVGLEIRREVTTGELRDPRVALLPVLGAFGGVIAPALIFLALNRGPAATGWSVPTATDIAFTLGILALLGPRVPPSLRLFIATLAVVDDVLSVVTLAIFYPSNFQAVWLVPALLAIFLLAVLNRWRVYAGWPYLVVALALWVTLHEAGIHAALAGVFLAAFLPTRPAPAVGPLLAQAATALSTLETAEHEAADEAQPDEVAGEPVWEWASRNLSAATERLLSPADRVERAVSPWSSYVILPLFAFSATGVGFDLDLSRPEAQRVLTGVVLGLAIGKPLGICLAAWVAIRLRIAVASPDISARAFLGAACLCGVGYTMSVLLADRAFADDPALNAVAKVGVLAGSLVAAAIGAAIIATAPKSTAAS